MKNLHTKWLTPVQFLAGLLLAATFVLAPAMPAAAQNVCGDSEIVVSGDTLRGIANRCDTTVDALLEANPSIVNPNLIYVGQTLRIPTSNAATADVAIAPTSGPAGTTVQVRATGFAPQQVLDVGIGRANSEYDIVQKDAVADADGTLETAVTFPSGATVGEVWVVAVTPEGETFEAMSNRFTVTEGEPADGSASVIITPDSGPAGTRVTVEATGLPGDTIMDIGAGPVASEYDIIAQASTAADGTLRRQVAIPRVADASEIWVIAVTPAGAPETYISNEFAVTMEQSDDALFTRTNIYLIALEDDGRSGVQVGCGDSAVAVEVPIEPTLGVMGAALRDLLNLDDRFYGQSGLYNALYRSDLTLDSVTIENREAIVNLSGEVRLGGVCDAPRFREQLRQTALQYYTVDSVSITINGQPLDEAIR